MQLDEGDEFVAPAGVVAAPATEQPAPEDDNTVKAASLFSIKPRTIDINHDALASLKVYLLHIVHMTSG
jgi:hypothetical protein